MMRSCPECGNQILPNTYLCKSCGANIIDSGELISALTHIDDSKPFSLAIKLLPPAIIAVSGIVAKAVGSYWVIGGGVLGAVFLYYWLRKKKRLRL
jgi:uncharacterized membrane protein YvbJ